ncbi:MULTISPECIES: type II 3-dehydroquinate dehydratase [Thiorhodovibrio]|uniref:type II 3-dehydroquinate dehydratase n=1 Tax=Thiorhodovibrio TaxID=61593 RepID=UPI0019124B8C|nr:MULTISPECIES: type II 3-dehydroquinate dehydratase [Thiorhodovibrio]MBK5970437.1 type II 3-dehydroquinate dehydratase [Thiorhodovibrio winogradskyi]WPL11439.1 3-dehydroquinate dehydratase [Thiorhodovibrio litoralis]
MSAILCLNGPNLNLLGRREPGTYGQVSLAQIEDRLRACAEQAGLELRFVQSNAEHVLIDEIQRAPEAGVDFMIFNPAAFTHTSIALRDAILAVKLPFIEVHLSNIHARESFRAQSYFSDIAEGVISGLGADGYELALTAAQRRLQ